MWFHNHFAICATGFDSKRFHEDGAMRHRMMDVNDELCRKYGLSVCENRAWGHKQRFVDKKMKERGLKSYREQLRDDIDQAVYEFGKLSYDLDKFFIYLGNASGRKNYVKSVRSSGTSSVGFTTARSCNRSRTRSAYSQKRSRRSVTRSRWQRCRAERGRSVRFLDL